MKLKVFTQKKCPKCPLAKKLAEELQQEGRLEVEFYDVEEREGLAEAQFYSILATPTLILCHDNEEESEKKSWRGEVPSKEEIEKEL